MKSLCGQTALGYKASADGDDYMWNIWLVELDKIHYSARRVDWITSENETNRDEENNFAIHDYD